MTVVTLGYFGWIFYCLLHALRFFTLTGQPYTAARVRTSDFIFGISYILVSAYLAVQSAPLSYHAYVFFPIFFYSQIFKFRDLIAKYFSELDVPGSVVAKHLLIYLCTLEVVVCGWKPIGDG